MAVCALAALLVAPANAASRADLTPDGATLTNDALRCDFSAAGGRWRLQRLARPDGTDALTLDVEPLVLVLYDGTEVGAEHLRCTKVEADGTRVVARLECAEPRITGTLTYRLQGDDPWLRKDVTLTGDPDVVVDELRLLEGTLDAPVSGGGRGLPLWAGERWWLGVEYPLGYATVADESVLLRHYPGRDLSEPLRSKTMVIGVAPPGRVARTGFDDYVQAIKRPSRTHLQYNSWYDLRGDDMTIENLLATARGFHENLLEPYGLQMHSFVPDDGWQDRQSVWEPRADLYPDGFAPLADALDEMGMRLGLWMPLTGFNLDMQWAAAQGYEVSDRGRYFCLSSPHSFEAVKRATGRRIADGRLAYYKHDFNFLTCTAEGHRHLPTERHSREANLDALLRLLAWERECNPQIFQNVTSAVWLSPWWLEHCDTIWMCASDFGYEKTFPQLAPREWAMSYRDAHFHDVYLRRGNPTPLSSLMTHGIIKGQRNRLGGRDETLREWADYVALYFGRGVLLKELYITPDLLDEPRWHVLGTAARWATDNRRTLQRTRMFGGDPRRGEPYGYAHWRGSRGIIVLRNPHHRAMTLRLPIDEATGYLGEHTAAFAVRQVYPAHVSLPAELSPGGSNELTLPPCSVWLLELRPSAGWPSAPRRAAMPDHVRALRDSARIERPDGESMRATVTLGALPPHERVQAYAILRGDTEHLTVRGTLGDGDLPPRRASGEGWMLCAFDLLPQTGDERELQIDVRADDAPPLFPPWAELQLRLIGDAGERAADDPFADEAVPWACGQGLRRYSVRLLPPTRLDALTAAGGGRVADEQLRDIEAARLRLEVFDVNGGERYAGKQILLNGRAVAGVPTNTGELSAWQEHVIELPADALHAIERTNRVVLTNAGGDCYKFRGLALAVQTPDGTWVVAGPDRGVYSSVASWLYAEGETFDGDRSPPVTLTIP